MVGPLPVYPVLAVSVNNVTYNASDTISLTYPSPTAYQVICVAVNSKPDVALALFDSNSSLSLGNASNSATSSSCDATYRLCNTVYAVSLQLAVGSPFASMSSLTCMATSKIAQVDLNTTLSRAVRINNTLGALSSLIPPLPLSA